MIVEQIEKVDDQGWLCGVLPAFVCDTPSECVVAFPSYSSVTLADWNSGSSKYGFAYVSVHFHWELNVVKCCFE